MLDINIALLCKILLLVCDEDLHNGYDVFAVDVRTWRTHNLRIEAERTFQTYQVF